MFSIPPAPFVCVGVCVCVSVLLTCGIWLFISLAINFAWPAWTRRRPMFNSPLPVCYLSLSLARSCSLSRQPPALPPSHPEDGQFYTMRARSRSFYRTRTLGPRRG